MSFLDSAEYTDKTLEELDNLNDVDREVARSKILHATSTKPERAAKSQQMAPGLGLPAEIVNEDYDQYEPEFKAQKNADYVDDKPHLTDFINSHPMAAPIAQDDYENLDHWHNVLDLLLSHAPEFDRPVDRFMSALGSLTQGLGSLISAAPKQVAMVSKQMAISRAEGVDTLLPQAAPVDDSAAAAAAFRLRRGQLHLTAEQVGERKKVLQARADQPIEDDPFYMVGEMIDELVKTVAPSNKDFEGDFWTSSMPSAIGSMVGFILGGMTLRAVKVGGTPVVPTAFGIAGLGAVSQSVDQFDDAVQNGASLKDALISSGYGAFLGTSEALPILHFMDRLDKYLGGGPKKALANILTQALEEGTQSFGQKVGSNIVANQIVGYDPKRGTWTGSTDDAVVGFTSAALMQAFVEALSPRKAHAAGAGKLLANRARVLKQYIESGDMPPPGTDPVMDQIHAIMAKEDAKKLKDVMDAAQASQTRELSPDLGEAFGRQRAGNTTISFSIDAIDKLYADEQPEPDDGKLGFVSDIVHQVAVARQTGGDVEVPLAALMARGDPEVLKEVEKDIRVRKGGMTLAEAEAFEERKKAFDEGFDVYHGSGQEFKELDPSKIGTGEGSQAYGHGLYVAEHPEVARSYVQEDATVNGERFNYNNPVHRAAALVDRYGYEKALDEASDLKTMDQDPDGFNHSVWRAVARGNVPKLEHLPGHFYKGRVRAPKEAFLDYDKPMHKQSPQVKAALEKIGISGESGAHGEDLKMTLRQWYGSDKAAAAKMREAGLPGIKYLDKGSRNQEGEGTSNYVIFDPSIIALTHRNDAEIQTIEELAMREIGAMTFADVLRPKATIEKVSEEPDPNHPDDPIFSNYTITNDAGQQIGELTVQLTPKNVLYLAGITGYKPGASTSVKDRGSPNVFGIHTTSDIYRQLARDYPTATHIGGWRVTGARDKVGKHEWVLYPLDRYRRDPVGASRFLYSISLAEQDVTPVEEGVPLPGQQTAQLDFMQVTWRPAEFYSQKESEVVGALTKLLHQFAPGLTLRVVDVAAGKGAGIGETADVAGYYSGHRSIADAYVIVALSDYDRVGTLLHEVIHHLRTGFFTAEEWAVLEHAAVNENWMFKHNISTKYPEAPEWLRIEEAIAEEFRKWAKREYGIKGKTAPEVVPIFRRLKGLFTLFKDRLELMFGKGISVDKLFTQVATGEIGSRQQTTEGAERFYSKGAFSHAFSVATENEELEMFAKGSALGLTQAGFKRLMTKIRENRAAMEAMAKRRAEKGVQFKKSKEWKDNAIRVREEITKEVNARGDIIADDYFRRGLIGGKPVSVTKMGTQYLSEDDKTVLGRGVHNLKGMPPDVFAKPFGFKDGAAMVDALVQLQVARQKLSMLAYKNKLIKERFEARMMKEYGEVERRELLQEAREDIVTETVMEQTYEELLAAAMKAGSIGLNTTPPWTLKSIKVSGWVYFAKMAIARAQDIATFNKDAGKAGNAAFELLLAGKATEALIQKQKQMMSIIFASESKALLRKMKANERLLKRFFDREVSGVSQEYTDQIHAIMVRLGREIERGPVDLAKATTTSLEKFVQTKQGQLLELDVSPLLFNAAFNTPFEKMTVEEYLAVSESLRQLAHVGRFELQVEKLGERMDRRVITEEMIESLEDFGKAVAERQPRGTSKIFGQEKGTTLRVLRSFTAKHIFFETFANRWDRFNPWGVFNQYVVRPLAESANRFANREKYFAKKVAALYEDGVDLDEEVPNPLLLDRTGELIPMTRRLFRAVMANIGNDENLQQFAEGYMVEPDALMLWVHSVATKEDWKFAQGLGDIFDEIKEASDRMYQRLTGTSSENIVARSIKTKFGAFRGWYNPLIRDHTRSPLTADERAAMSVGYLTPQFFRATTPNGYTKKRTGGVYVVSLDLRLTISRMRQMIYDTEMREAIINAGKFFSDTKLRDAIRKHSAFGEEVVDQMEDYLKDVANQSNVDDESGAFLETLRQNAISGVIGLNPGTVLKHAPTAFVQSVQEAGALKFMKEYAFAAKNLFTRLPHGELNWSLAFEKSEELQRRMRHWMDTVGGGYRAALGERSLRATLQWIGAQPVAMSDLFSAVPMWLAVYRQQKEEHGIEGDAIYMADRAVRRAHGSTAVTNLPAVMRGGALARWFTSVFGFMVHMTNRNAELLWRIADTYKEFRGGNIRQGLSMTAPIMKQVGGNVAKFGIRHAGKGIAGGIVAYVIMPAVFEALASPLPHDDDDSFAKIALKDLIKYLLSLGVGVREIAGYMATGGNPSVGLIGTGFRNLADVWGDITDVVIKDKDKAAKLVKDAALTVAIFAGLSFAQLGKTGEFMINYLRGDDRPSKIGNLWMTEEDSLLRGLRYGRSSTKRRRSR